MLPHQNLIYLHSPSVHENCAKLGAEMKNSDLNHPKEPYMVHYPPYVVPKIIRVITLKLLGYRIHATSSKFQYSCIAFQCLKIALSWGAEMKNSDPNHPKALFRVYYPPHLVPKTMGVITLKLLASPGYALKLPI